MWEEFRRDSSCLFGVCFLSLPVPSYITILTSIPKPVISRLCSSPSRPHKHVFPCSLFPASPGLLVFPISTSSVSTVASEVWNWEHTNKFWEMHICSWFLTVFLLLWEKNASCFCIRRMLKYSQNTRKQNNFLLSSCKCSRGNQDLTHWMMGFSVPESLPPSCSDNSKVRSHPWMLFCPVLY